MARGKRLTVVRPGSRVGIRVPEVQDATVLEVHIGPDLTVSYQVAWWIEGERYTDRLEAWEIDPDPPERVSVGFRRPGERTC